MNDLKYKKFEFFNFYKGVPKYIQKFLIENYKCIFDEFTIRNDLRIDCVPAPIVTFDKKKFGFGAFDSKHKRIVIGCKPGSMMLSWKRSEYIRIVLESLIHELIHYEQYRTQDGLMHHRGIERKTREIANKILGVTD